MHQTTHYALPESDIPYCRVMTTADVLTYDRRQTDCLACQRLLDLNTSVSIARPTPAIRRTLTTLRPRT
jgi:hypothetical protein